MSTAEQIIQEITSLRPEKQSEVLEFVEFLKEKERKAEDYEFKERSLLQPCGAWRMRKAFTQNQTSSKNSNDLRRRHCVVSVPSV